jgi:hypothetical protein
VKRDLRARSPAATASGVRCGSAPLLP